VQVEADAAHAGSGPIAAPRARRFHMVLPGTQLAVRQTLEDITRHVLLATDDPELTGDAQIVLAEVMNNIVEHALAARSDGVIEVILRVEPSGIDCMLRDDGCAMPGGRLPDAVATQVIDPRAEPREGGFGWPLVRALAGDLAYRRQGEWNETRLTVPCRTAGALVSQHPA
jgi:serine/threonine-protein kinase RsbW